ncbi:MAG: undecaprenyl-diphosphatase UppP [Alphaproteobacteria bacterium]|nr:undecaprenyl-diphosphatase UppP [Alphaproteobacteria bacterium]OJV12233.1 MAG: undecaprenyl-diphosphatase UppP [Alphaproteobacteria bacterium 33-17]
MYTVIEFISAIILGLVEGLTEFLPISSTAHLIFVQKFIPISSVPNELFDVVIQLGSLAAFVIIRKDFLFQNVVGFFKNQTNHRNFGLYIILAMLPAIIIGFALSDFIAELKTIPVIGTSLIIGGIILIMVDKYKPDTSNDDMYKLGFKNALVIGIIQTIAFIPGVSRSGSTICAGILTKQSRNVAVEFSFMLGLATMIAASSYSLIKYIHAFNKETAPIIIAAMVSSFLSSLFTANFLINFLKVRGLYIFGAYRIIVGFIFIILL